MPDFNDIYVKHLQCYKQLKLVEIYLEAHGQNCPKIEDAVKWRRLIILRKKYTKSFLV